MEYKYDKETNILLIRMNNGVPDFGEQKENIITHYNKEGVPIQIEILDASQTVAKLVELVLRNKKVTN